MSFGQIKESYNMPKCTGKKTTAIFVAAAMAVGGVFAGSAASAQGDLYFMHNASAYYVWSDLSICESDLGQSGNPCTSWGSTPACGRVYWATPATTSVAADKLKRNEAVILHHTKDNSGFCQIGE